MYLQHASIKQIQLGAPRPWTLSSTLKFLRRRWLPLLGIVLLLAALGCVAALYFSVPLLRPEDRPASADMILLLGGEVLYRPPRALELYQQGAAPAILISGKGDCEEYRIILEGRGVPASALRIECDSRTTRENARLSVPLLRAAGARRVILVTSWFHSRRALGCFRHYAPDIQFFSLPTTADLPQSHWPNKRERSWVLAEYLKLVYYWVRFGICPF